MLSYGEQTAKIELPANSPSQPLTSRRLRPNERTRKDTEHLGSGRLAAGRTGARSQFTEDSPMFEARVYKVMLATPGDVPNERQAVRDAVHYWNAILVDDRRGGVLPAGWETHVHPMMGERPQAVINKKILKDCDLLIAVFWTRLGSPTGEAPSGTVEEIEEHLKAGKPAMIYFSNAPVRPDSIDEAQYRALREFRADCERRGLIE